MKKRCILPVVIFFVLFFTLQGSAQVLEEVPLPKAKRCVSAEELTQYIKDHPGAETIEQFESWMSVKIREVKEARQSHRISPSVTLPVVFHIIHDGEAVGTGRNLSQAAIHQQVLQLNKDFANLSGSPYAVAEDMGIRFALAQNDPDGVALAEPGIDRIDRNTEGWTAPPYTVRGANNYLANTIKPNSIWDPARYLNIWVSEWEAGILGIATFPASSTLAGLDNRETDTNAGVAIGYNTVGSVFAPQACDNPYGLGRTLTHELGHFFGLRHIWGDANCGTDFCDDTPVHRQSNGGEPRHPKANTCGTADEMFENYMDYSDDIITNTFTANQGDRMEAVFTNSPRRATLTTSNAGLVEVTATNRITFADCDGAMTVSENATVTGCPRYRELQLLVNVEDRATDSATLTIVTGGTAISGVHYQLVTPTLTFEEGDDSKVIVVRIFDDAVVSGNRTIILSYTIGNGNGVTAGPGAQTLTITIEDNDYNAVVDNVNPPSVNLIEQNFGITAGSNQLPAGWLSRNNGSATNKWVVNSAGAATYGFTGNTAHISSGSAAAVANGTAGITYSTTTTTDARLYTPTVDATGLTDLTVSFDFVSDGEQDADYGILYYTVDGNNYVAVRDYGGNLITFQGYPNLLHQDIRLPAAAYGSASFGLLFRWFSDNSAGSSPPFAIDNITITGRRQTIETQQGHSVAIRASGGTDNYFYSSNDAQLITKISGLTDTVGCITATIQAAGTGRTAVTTSAGNGFRSQKVVRVTPASNSTTAGYQITLYYTLAEMAAWPAAERATLRIMKLRNDSYVTNNYTAADGHVIPTAFSDQSANGYYSYTATVTDGFSDFILVSSNITLPVSLLSFDAKAQKTAILLQWSTSQEINNKGFAIERSLNGVDFEQIGWVGGAGNTFANTDYAYTDRQVQPGVVYYYRLRQTDFDNQVRISSTRQGRIDHASLVVKITPNPASDHISVAIAGASGKADIDLVNSMGQVIKRWRGVNTTTTRADLDISGIASGTYLVAITIGDKKVTEKLVIGPY